MVENFLVGFPKGNAYHVLEDTPKLTGATGLDVLMGRSRWDRVIQQHSYFIAI